MSHINSYYDYLSELSVENQNLCVLCKNIKNDATKLVYTSVVKFTCAALIFIMLCGSIILLVSILGLRKNKKEKHSRDKDTQPYNIWSVVLSAIIIVSALVIIVFLIVYGNQMVCAPLTSKLQSLLMEDCTNNV